MDVQDPKSRLISLDTLRGFDMFWIIGGTSIANGLVSLNFPWSRVIARQLAHSNWNGFTFYDLIFPLFVYITGVSVVLSLQKRSGQIDRRNLVKHILKRAVILFIAGIIYYDQISTLRLSHIRIMGVLQRISLCYLFSSIIVLYTKPRAQIGIVVGILFGYWAIMKFIPVPGYGAGIWTEPGNLPHYIDNLLLPGRLYYGSWDPEGLLTTIPAFATCLLGVLSGYWLKPTKLLQDRILNDKQRVLYLCLGGAALVILGLLSSSFFPVNKKLWTSSFVLLTGGLSCILLAAFYWIIDIRGHRIPAFPFMIIGMNSIFIYFAAEFIPFNSIAAGMVSANHLIHWGRSQSLVAAVVELTMEGLLLLWLYRQRIFIRI